MKAPAANPGKRAGLLRAGALLVVGIVPLFLLERLSPVGQAGLWACIWAIVCVSTWDWPVDLGRGVVRVLCVLNVVLALLLALIRALQ